MKNNIYLLLLPFCLCANQTLQAQWTPQADKIFGALFSVDAHRAVDAQVNWAGVNVFPWSSAPTLSGWVTRTADGGATWKYSQIPGAEGYVVWGVSALDADLAWVSMNYRADRTKSRIYRTQDGGDTWQLQFEGPGAGFFTHFFDGQNGVMVRGNKYRHSSDSGATWSALDSFPAVNNGVFLIPTELFDVCQDTIWVPTAEGKISKSTDKGKTWQTYSTYMQFSGVSANMLDFSDGRQGLAVAAFSSTIDPNGFYPALPYPRLFNTADGGLTWQEIPSFNLPLPADDINISAIGAVPGLPGTYLMVAGYFDTGTSTSKNFIYQSNDNGLSWTLVGENPANFGLQSLEFVSPTAGWGGIGGDFTPGVAHFFRWNGIVSGTSETTANNTLLQVMPNPASDQLTLRLPEDAPMPGMTAFIFDAQGRLMWREQTGAYTEIDISRLAPGAYTALVQDAQGKIVGVKRWVKGE